jgi:hypothetical protein
MVWAICVIAVIGVGLPVTTWLMTRGLARRPPTPLKPYHGRVDSWIHRQYGLDWAECSLVHAAVAQGRRVSNPALEDAAHRLAAAVLRGKVPGVRALRLAAGVNVVLGLGMAVLGISLFWTANRLLAFICVLEGAWFITIGRLNFVRGPGRQRQNAARALELNQIAAHP